MGKVIKFPGLTTVDIPVENVLEGAKGFNLDYVLVIGKTKDGEYVAAASTSDMQRLLWVIESLKHQILSGVYGDE